MILSPEIKHYIDKSVLCWLATCSQDRVPNVSPKEAFTYFGEDQLIIANVASPQSVKNIRKNPQVCVSFVDILVQKGFKLKGKAELVNKNDLRFSEMKATLLPIIGERFPFSLIISIQIQESSSIIAPSYLLFPETKEEEQIISARKTYGL